VPTAASPAPTLPHTTSLHLLLYTLSQEASCYCCTLSWGRLLRCITSASPACLCCLLVPLFLTLAFPCSFHICLTSFLASSLHLLASLSLLLPLASCLCMPLATLHASPLFCPPLCLHLCCICLALTVHVPVYTFSHTPSRSCCHTLLCCLSTLLFFALASYMHALCFSCLLPLAFPASGVIPAAHSTSWLCASLGRSLGLLPALQPLAPCLPLHMASTSSGVPLSHVWHYTSSAC